ncbi:hypothetical protein AMK22_34600 [Streptomyces sp. CB01580]|nr:hypothetical protein AMK22_34600 [Streptomyces sp. CB01580]
MPSSRATAVTVLPEESTSAIASRLNSSVYRFVYLLPTDDSADHGGQGDAAPDAAQTRAGGFLTGAGRHT